MDGPDMSYRKKHNDALQRVSHLTRQLKEIIPMCGNPNAIDACRLIANKCQEALK